MMWLAHALTLSRLPIAVAFWWAYGDTARALALLGLAALTDILDGNLARWARRRGATGPDIGGWLDPLVDKLFVAIALVVLWLHAHDLRVIALIGARELVLVPLIAIYFVRRRPAGELHADPIGKAATIAQFAALAIVLGHPPWALPAAAVAAVLGLAAVAHYAIAELRLRRYSRVRGSDAS